MTQEEFKKLIEKYLAGNASPLEERIIDDFFSTHERKSSEPSEELSKEMWDLIEEKVQTTHHQTISPPQPDRKSIWMKRVLVSFVLIVVLGLSAWYLFASSGVERPALLTSKVAKGQRSIITLSDGSKVYLNSSSAISYPASFSGSVREVWLEGEAFFEITRDEKKPFLIHSSKITTKVLGTSFNINAFDTNNISVSVASGKVQVETDEDVHERTGTGDGSTSVILLPNQQALYRNQGGFITRNIDVEELIAWKNNTLFFNDASLQEVAEILERWYDVTIEFDNTDISKCHVNGKYKTPTLKIVLESIQYMYDIKYKFQNEDKIRLYGKGC